MYIDFRFDQSSLQINLSLNLHPIEDYMKLLDYYLCLKEMSLHSILLQFLCCLFYFL